MNSLFEVRQIVTIEELQQVQQLEKAVWNDQVIPVHQTLTAIKNGGIIIGAFQDDKLVGFSYGFPGFLNGQSFLCSHMLGIAEDLRGQGIGAILKETQRMAAIEQGYSLLTWTYDPLESVNAFLNLSKLKAICSTYVEDCYGKMEDELNQGLPSDRFQVEWWIKSPYLDRHQDDDPTVIERLPYEKTVDGQPQLLEVDTAFFNNHEALLVPFPKQFQHIKKDNPELALDWRIKTRQVFQALFANGFAAVSVVKMADEPIYYYVLKKRNTLPLESRVSR